MYLTRLINFFRKITAAVLRNLLLSLVGFYQAHISCHLATACRFYPTCSHYAVEVIKEENFLTALKLIIKRLLRCHPLASLETSTKGPS